MLPSFWAVVGHVEVALGLMSKVGVMVVAVRRCDLVLVSVIAAVPRRSVQIAMNKKSFSTEK